METTKKLPVGIEGFFDIRNEGFYFVDKTGLIKALMNNWGEVNLLTRPRRFGKTLNIDMLRNFFEIGTDGSLFDGLEISKEKDLCEKYMGQFPVLSISLKSVVGDTFDTARDMLCQIINEEARRLQWLMDSERLTKYDKRLLEKILLNDFSKTADLYGSLKALSEALYKHYEKKVILLIDEYDVPLEKAYVNGYYDDMILLIRMVFERALKTNNSLYFAVITGCLRISKESIFTGLNHFSVHTLSDALYDEYFGFTEKEVRKLLADYHLEEKYAEVREWYDGYRFGRQEVYCPWDVICYVKDHLADRDVPVKTYWANSSGNAIVRSILQKATGTAKAQLETLLSGGEIEITLAQEMTYQDLDTRDSIQQLRYLWTMLYTTGYLTDASPPAAETHKLILPNREIQWIFEQQAESWFLETAVKDKNRLKAFLQSVRTGNAKEMQKWLNCYLKETISVRDSGARYGRKEHFYHGILVGLLSSEGAWITRSNAESGLGYSDILIEIPDEKIGCVIEIKYADKGNLGNACREAFTQIEKKDYSRKLRQDGMETIHRYGIGCHLKTCEVISDFE